MDEAHLSYQPENHDIRSSSRLILISVIFALLGLAARAAVERIRRGRENDGSVLGPNARILAFSGANETVEDGLTAEDVLLIGDDSQRFPSKDVCGGRPNTLRKSTYVISALEARNLRERLVLGGHMSWERVRSIRLHPMRAVLAVTLVSLVVTSAFAQTPAELSVRATRAAEHQPAANDGFLGWQSASREHPHRYNAYIKPTGEALFRVNSAGTQGAMGGIDGTTLVYQEYRFDPDLSDLKLFDLATRTRSDPPTGVNTVRWEYFPSLSGDWLLFGRLRLSDGYRTVVLHNLVTGEERVLASAQSAWLGPGQIRANYAVWEKCKRRECDVFRYDILADASRRIPNPVDLQYAPAVTSSGTMYFVRHGPLCASRAKIFRRNLGSDSELMTTIRSGRNVTELYADTSSTGDVGIYYERFVLTDTCRIPLGRSDIYKLVDEGPITSASSSSQSAAGLLRGESRSARYFRKYQERNESSRGFDSGS